MRRQATDADTIARAIRVPLLVEALQTWRRLCGDRFAPTRPEIRPTEFRRLLGRLALIEVRPDQVGDARYYYRLMGTRLAVHDACDLTGKPLSAHPRAEQRAVVRAALDAAVATRGPVYREDPLPAGGKRRTHARLVLPLSNDGATVTHLLLARVLLSPAD
jgi:hypothetical protein